MRIKVQTGNIITDNQIDDLVTAWERKNNRLFQSTSSIDSVNDVDIPDKSIGNVSNSIESLKKWNKLMKSVEFDKNRYIYNSVDGLKNINSDPNILRKSSSMSKRDVDIDLEHKADLLNSKKISDIKENSIADDKNLRSSAIVNDLDRYKYTQSSFEITSLLKRSWDDTPLGGFDDDIDLDYGYDDDIFEDTSLRASSTLQNRSSFDVKKKSATKNSSNAGESFSKSKAISSIDNNEDRVIAKRRSHEERIRKSLDDALSEISDREGLTDEELADKVCNSFQ